jgi:Carboxypeptidase regulatory-like domain/TonB dependent receptor
MRAFCCKSIGVAFSLLILIAQVLGQGGATGAIAGTVIDPSGAVVPNAEIRVTNEQTGLVERTAKTDSGGSFTVPLLTAGTYTVSVSSSGFQETKFGEIAVRVTETTRMQARLRPLAVQEKVEVTAQVQTIETTAATTGQAIESSTIRNLPLATQNFQQLLTLSTGVASELNASSQLGRGATKIFVNGQREDNNNYLIEGISATDYNVAQATNVPLPNPDVLGEFKVQTSLYDASQGRNGGGNVNAILKSGTKTFHGDLYEFFRNDVLNANEYFQKGAGRPRPPVKQNIFGGSLGGPIGKNAEGGFFFVNYQGTRQRSALSPGTAINNPGFPVLPTDRSDATLEALFGVPIIDPVIHNLLNFKSNQFGDFPGGFLIPSIPGTPGSTAPFIFSRPGRYTDDQFTTNWDRDFRAGNDKVSARFFFSNSESFLPFGAGGLQESLGATLSSSIAATDLDFPYDLPIAARFLSINETHLFSPALVNDFRFGYVRINNSLQNVPPVTAADLGIDRPTNNVTKSIYKFTLNSSGFQIGPSPTADQFQTQNNYNFVDTMSWVRGSHVLRFGGEYTRVDLDKLFPQVFNGQLIFASSSGGLTDFQQFLEGSPPFSFGGGGVFNHQYRTNNFAVFVQDDWKARSDLTLNLGLRTEILGAFHDNLCHIGNLDPDLADRGQYPFIYGGCVKGLNVTGLTPTGSNTTYKNDYATGLGPRIGLAWDIFGHHTTSLRGGYGIYFVREDVGSVDQLSFQAPFLPVAFGGGLPGCASTFFSANAPANCIPVGSTSNPNALPAAGTIDSTFVPCLALFQGFTNNDPNQAPNYACNGSGIPSTNIFGLVVPRHFVTPNTQQWNLTLQRELGRRWVLEVGYVGTHAIHLRETRTSLLAQRVSPSNPLILTQADGTQAPPIIFNTSANGPARSRALGINGYSGMQLFADDAYSHYHSLQTTLSRRWGAGYFQAAYTFSRSTDATSSGNTAFNTAFNDESTLDASRGLSDFDRRHRFVVSYRYDLPIFKGATGAKRALLSNWSISGISTFQSGTPFSVLDTGSGTAFIGAGLTTTLTGTLAPGGSVGAGLSHRDIHQRLNGYLNASNFTTAPLLYGPNLCDPSQNDPTVTPNSTFCTTDFGDLGRNIYHGPFQQNWDFSLIKNFKMTERQAVRFTADFFNIWNHANFANPAQADVENPSTFGKITQTVGTPRLIQLSLRWAF